MHCHDVNVEAITNNEAVKTVLKTTIPAVNTLIGEKTFTVVELEQLLFSHRADI